MTILDVTFKVVELKKLFKLEQVTVERVAAPVFVAREIDALVAGDRRHGRVLPHGAAFVGIAVEALPALAVAEYALQVRNIQVPVRERARARIE